MKIIKFLMAGIAVIVVLAILLIGIFLATFDANQYRQDLSQLVKQQTGRDLLFNGDIGLTLYPSLGMKLGSMSLSNAAGFGDRPMLSVDKASVSVDVLSLLKLQPEIARLLLDGLSVDLQKNSQGKTNWDDLVATQSTAAATEPAEDKAKVAEAGAGLDIQGAFGGLAVSHVNLTWSDAVAGVEYQVKNLSLSTGRIVMGQSFPLQLNMSLQSRNELSAELKLHADVILESGRLTLSSLKLETSAKGELIPVDSLQLQLAGDVDFSLVKNQLAIRGFTTEIQTTGGVLQHSATSLAGEIGFDLNQQRVVITALNIHTKLQGAAVPKGEMSSSVSASQLDLQLAKRSVVLDDLVLALNENQFNGFVQVQDYAQPAVKFELSTQRFDVDKLMGVSDQPALPEPEAQQAPAEDIQIQLPMELIRSLKLDGSLTVGTLIVQGLTTNDVLLKLDAGKGIVDVNPLTMRLYEGSLDAAIQLNAQGEKPVYSVKQTLSSFQIGKFLKDFMGDDMVSGAANMDVNVTAGGEWLSQLKSSLNGKLGIQLKDGALKGFNLRHSIESAKAKLRREKVPELVEKKTDFSALSLSAVIVNGVFSSEDLDMQAPLVRAAAKGSVDLVQETLDYRVNAKLVTTIKGQQGGAADDLAGVEIPVAITGSWLSPDINVLLDDILKARFDAEKARIREDVARQKAALKKTLDAEKAKLKAAQEKELAAKQQQLQKQQELKEAELKSKLDAEKQSQQAELDAKKQAEQERAKKKLEDKLKNLF